MAARRCAHASQPADWIWPTRSNMMRVHPHRRATLGELSDSPGGRLEPLALPRGDPTVPDAGAGGGVHARQALAGAWRHRGGASAGDQPPAPGRQDRDGLPRLRPAAERDHLRGQCRPDAGGQAVRSRPRLPARDLRDVVDSRGDPGVHPALLVAGQDGHHGGAEEAVLQPAQAQGPDAGDRRGRSARPRRSRRSPSASTSPRPRWSR